ncbi:MAG: cysteine desulfurase [Ruminococcaceae bacterium]|nr:cysteine desulfurase [Oscillospiraceae bacterium]
MSIYLDNAATTAVCPEAAAAAMDAMTVHYGNPSSTHALGREAAALLTRARARVSLALGCKAEELAFTSCGSEGDNWAILKGAEYQRRVGTHIISSTVEHAAVGKALDELEARGYEVTRLKPGRDGAVSPDAVMNALRPDTALVTLMLVNNETGAVTDVGAIAAAVHAANARTLVHTDAVQAFLKVPFSPGKLGVDLLTVSGHKIHAPKGIGALYIRSGLYLPPFILGGGQEQGRRSGTESLPLIAAFGAACDAAMPTLEEDRARMASIRAHCVQRLCAENEGLRVLGGGAPQILSISLPGWRSEVLMNFLEAQDIYVSKSSACKRGGRSYVLEQMGLDAPVIDGALRVSFSRFTTMEEADAFCDALCAARQRLRHR